MKKNLILFLAVAVLASCSKEVIWVPDGYVLGGEKPTGEYVPDEQFKRVAYCYHNTAPTSFDTSKLDYVTHLHFAFLNPREDGTLQALANLGNFQALKELAKTRNVKTAISLSGSETVFRTVMANATTRKQFVKNVVDFAVLHQLDGVDLDWEYPRANQGGDVVLRLLVEELSAELHSWHKYLSIAVTAGIYAGAVRDGITPEALDHVDFVNLMAYDGIGTDPNNPNHHSSLGMAERVLNIWMEEKGLPKEKAVLGIPVYGKNANNASMTFSALLTAGADPLLDEFIINNVAYYYNGVNTVKSKTQLAKDQANGVMFWEYNQDARGDNSLLKAAYDVGR
ncbi:Chitinase, GH18 family [Parapedobacter composti]|uniref:chitinase n=1 Tax=Parapedobacter composti TaxID=623281 RepID=A0A1I1J9V4_9SPHI|nr:glycosyl hydrolase family 18 protein [Parapedobacter composti]SFC43388.1 Chitinase, GH18 family [Parapedobacter composti]